MKVLGINGSPRIGGNTDILLGKVLEGAQGAWYEFVKNEQGENVKLPAGNGLTHYLMAIPKKLYEEDMAEQQKLVTETTRQEVKVKAAAGEYSPEGHDSAITRDI